MATKTKSLLGLVLLAGLSWAIADGVKTEKTAPGVAEQNAITVDENEHCKRPAEECLRHSGSGQEAKGMESDETHADADCPKTSKCPKGSPQCCKKNGKHAKTANPHAGAAEPENKPAESVKSKDPAAK